MGISNRDVTIVLPTRGRKARVGSVLSALDHPHDRTLIVVDDGREAEDLPDNLNGHIVVKCKPDCGSVKAMEAGAEAAQTSHVLFLNDDVELDADCLSEAIRCYNEKFPNGDGVLGLNHGEQWKGLACFALMPRAFYMEHCYPTPYKRYCIDNEWTEKATALGLLAHCDTAKLKHDFPGHQQPDHDNDWNLFVPRLRKWAAAHSSEIDKAHPHKPTPPSGEVKLFIGIPVFSGVDVNFFDSMMKFHRATEKINCRIAVVAGDSLVPRARNTLTMEFLNSDCTHLLFIDSDLVFSAKQIARMLKHDVDIVGGFYPKKQQGPCEMVFNPTIPPEPMDERGLTPVRYIGTGFVLIKRAVFEKMISEFGDEMIFSVDGKPGKFGFDFWKVGCYQYKDGLRRYLSEDWYFCQKAIDLGFTVYGDNRVILKHSGSVLYPLKTQEMELFGQISGNGEGPAAASPASPPKEAAATA